MSDLVFQTHAYLADLALDKQRPLSYESQDKCSVLKLSFDNGFSVHCLVNDTTDTLKLSLGNHKIRKTFAQAYQHPGYIAFNLHKPPQHAFKQVVSFVHMISQLPQNFDPVYHRLKLEGDARLHVYFDAAGERR